jgi:hypothetical protein
MDEREMPVSGGLYFGTISHYKWPCKALLLKEIRCFIHQVLLSLKTKGLFEPKSTPLKMKS